MIRDSENANREYKNSLFTEIFNNEKEALALYNSIANSHYDLDSDVQIKTLPDVFYRGLKNDVALKVKDKLIVFFEHQSSYDPNIAFRMLLYCANVYKGLVPDGALHSGKKLALHYPEFYLLTTYDERVDGKKPDVETKRLSELFKEIPKNEDPSLELRMRVINIDIGRNQKLIASNPKLYGYAVIIHKISAYNREELKGIKRPTTEQRREALRRAIKRAMDYCIAKGILGDFIKENAVEVYNMLTEEFDITVAERIWKEEAWLEGKLKGKLEGKLEGWEEALNLMRQGYTLEQLESIRSSYT